MLCFLFSTGQFEVLIYGFAQGDNLQINVINELTDEEMMTSTSVVSTVGRSQKNTI